MNCEIITIGDELLIGQVVDTNSAWMADKLNEAGIEVKQITSIHDDASHIIEALDAAFKRADLVLTTGGLGPTKDDMTKQVLCEYFHTELVPNPEVEAHVRDLYKDRPDVLNRLTQTQWLVPACCEVLTNRVGSAPIMAFHPSSTNHQSSITNHQSSILICMPGVPYEMKIAMEEQVLPWVNRLQVTGDRLQAIEHRTLMVSGIAESALAIHLEEWEKGLDERGLHLAYLPKDGTIRLRIDSIRDALDGPDIPDIPDIPDNPDNLETAFEQLKSLVKEWLILDEDKPLEQVVGCRLQMRGLTISTAESCTGGKLAALLNKHSGSSAWYWGSVVAYDNSVKRNVLGVSQENLDTYGAVSEQVVRQMAEGVRKLCGTDVAIATSGVAGPTGGTAEKPVGTVWIAWATPSGTEAECFHLGRLREQITDRACMKALIKLLKII